MMKLPYELFIALRYLKAKKRHKAISLNTFISIGGVSLGVAALIATLAVMTGFSEDLRNKILGTNAHIIVQGVTRAGISDYKGVVTNIEKIPNVISAAPFIHNEVMLTSSFGTTGTVIRGIDPLLEVKATDIERTIKIGEIGPLGMIPKFKRFAVTGIFDSGMYEYDSKLAYISIPDAQKFFNTGDVVSAVAIRSDT